MGTVNGLLSYSANTGWLGNETRRMPRSIEFATGSFTGDHVQEGPGNRLSPRTALGVWLLGSLAGWALVVAGLLAFLSFL